MWLTIEKLIALPVQKEEFVWSWRQIQLVKLIATTNQTVWGPEGLGSHGTRITGAVITAHHDYLMLPVVYCTAGIIITSI